jgi:hypothetical protein
MKNTPRMPRVPPLVRSLALAAALVSALPLLASCGAAAPAPVSAPKGAEIDLDGDALLLLPPGAVLATTVDAHAFYENPSLGAQVSALSEALLPFGLGADAGLVPSRDVERVTFASYSLQGADAVAIVRGRFDAASIARVAGGVLTATPYAGRTLYTHGSVGFAVLSPRTLLGGSGATLRLALDRIQDGRAGKAELPPSTLETLRTKDVAAAFAADFGAAPLTALQGLPIPPWVASVKGARGVATFREPGVSISGSIAFDDPSHAAAGVDAVRQLGALINAIAISGAVPQLRSLTVSADGPNAQVAFAIDDGSLRSVLQQIPQWLPPRPSAAKSCPMSHDPP